MNAEAETDRAISEFRKIAKEVNAETNSQLVYWGVVLMTGLFVALLVLQLARPKLRYQLPPACTLLEINQIDTSTSLKFICTGRIVRAEIER